MTRFPVFMAVMAAFLTVGAAPSSAACHSGTLLDTCLDDGDIALPRGNDEEYERLDSSGYGGGYDGSPAPGMTMTFGDTVLTLGPGAADDGSEPWQQPLSGSFGDNEHDRQREDRPKAGGLDPAQVQCYADGCY